MNTTVKISQETKKRLLGLDLTAKGKTFDMVINDLLTFYEKSGREWKKSFAEYRKSLKDYEKNAALHKEALGTYKKEKKMWDALLEWAKSKGFRYP